MSNHDSEINSQLKEAIIRVIVFFDLFDYPLTAREIWHYLDKTESLLDINEALLGLEKIDNCDGFFFLAGRQNIIDIRRRRHNFSVRKVKIARRFAKIFCYLPFVRMVALSNSIGQHNFRDASDIDFFVISAAGRIWLTRLFCAGLAKILNRRPTAENKKDKICLSFYLAEDNLNLEPLKLAGGDPYFFYWQRSLILLYNKNRTYEKFLEANKILFNQSLITVSPEPPRLKIFDYLEKISKRLQFIIMSPALKKAANNSVGVVINDGVLKLYLRDNRQEYAEKYGNKLQQVFAKNN
jgi:hypothetical protein